MEAGAKIFVGLIGPPEDAATADGTTAENRNRARGARRTALDKARTTAAQFSRRGSAIAGVLSLPVGIDECIGIKSH